MRQSAYGIAQNMPKAGKRTIIWISMVAAVLLAAVVFYAYTHHASSGTPFQSDGYVLRVTDEQVERVYFAGNAVYRTGYPACYRFDDVQGNEIVVAEATFLHYANDAVGATTDGILLDLETLDRSGLTPFYRLNSDAVIMRAGDGAYQIEGVNGVVPLGTALLKLSDTTYLLCSDRLTLQLSAGNTVEVEGYLEISYVDESVIRLTSADAVWYTIAADAEVITPTGVRCCLADKRVRDGEGNVLMKLSEVLLDTDAAIEVLPGENIEWIVPRFDITTIDGDDGTEGDDGLEGVQGAEGTAGEDGTEGEGGASGSSGASGASGAAGATGGTAGSVGEESIAMPDIQLSAFTVNDTSFSGTLTVVDGQERLREDDAYNRIYVVELATGRETLVTEDCVFYSNGTYNFMNYPEGEIELTGLKTDTRYRLVVCSAYEVEPNEYQRVFISKEFTTDSIGLELKNAYTTETSGTVRLTKKEYCTANGAQLVLYKKSAFVSADSETGRIGTITVGPEDLLLSGKDITFFDENMQLLLSPNTEYLVVLKARKDAAYVTSEDILSFTTLKTLPVIEAPLVVTDQRSSVFTLTPKIVSDPHLSIRKYTYEIYNELTDMYVTSVSTDSSEPYTLPIDGVHIERDVFYKARLKVICNDNEKAVELISDDSNEFIMRGTGYPYVSFTYESSYLNPPETPVTLPDDGSMLSGFSNVDGTLRIDFNGSHIEIGSSPSAGINPLKVRIINLDQYEEVRFLYLDGTDLNQEQYANKFLEIPIVRNGLKADSTYLISVYGTVDLGDGLGEQSDFLVGSCVFQTANVPALRARWAEPTEGINTALAVYFALGPDENVAAKNAAHAADTLTRLQFNLYAGAVTSGTPLATYVMNDTDLNYYSSDIGDSVYEPAVGSGILITENEFNMQATELPPAVTIVAVDATDYTDTGSGQSIAEKDHNATTSGYVNHIPIANNSTTIVKSNTPPEIPTDDVLEVLRITNAEAEQYHLKYNQDLEPTTTVGFKLTPSYANDQALTRSITYYVYENAAFENWLNSDPESPRPGVGAGADAANGYIGQVTVNGITTASLDNAYAVVLLAGTEIDNSGGYTAPENYLLMEDAFTAAHQNKYGSYGANLAWGRGWDYCFAYDAMVSLNNTQIATHHFPYDNSDYAEFAVSDTPILHDNLQAYFQPPVMRSYPYTSNANSSTWQYRLTDIDTALLTSEYFRVTRGSVSQFQELTVSPLTSQTFAACTITCSSMPTQVTTQLRYRRQYGDTDYATLDTFSYTQQALNIVNAGAIEISIENKLASENQILLTLHGNEAVLRTVAGLRVVATDENNQLSDPIYPRVTMQSGIAGEATATASILSSQLQGLASGYATFRFTALYDSGISGFSYSASNFYAISVMGSGTNAIYLMPSNNNAVLTASYDGASNSFFSIDNFSTVLAQNTASVGYTSKTGTLKGTMQMDLTARGVYSPTNADWRLTLKQLNEVEVAVAGSAGGDARIEITTAVPFVNLNYTADITASIDRVSFKYRIEGVTEGAIQDDKIQDDKIYIRLYKKLPGFEGYELMDQDGLSLDVALDTDHMDKTYEAEIDGLTRGTEYRLEFYAYLLGDGDTYNETVLLRVVGDEIQKAQYAFSTVSEVNITDITHSVVMRSYYEKTLTLGYKLDRTFGFHIKINLEKWSATGGEGGTGGFVPYKTYAEMSGGDMPTLPHPYAEDQLYSPEMNCVFDLRAGSLIEPGTRYRFEIVAIANEKDSDNNEVVLGTGYHEYRRPAAAKPIFSVMSAAKYTAPEEGSSVGNHAITYTIMPSDAQRVIVDGKYVLRLFKVEAGGALTPVSIGAEASIARNIGRAYTFTVNDLTQGTDYALYYYAVTDMDNSGGLDSMEELMDGVEADEALRPTADNPYVLGSKTQSTLGASGVELGVLGVALRPGTTSYLRLVFTDAYGIASIDELTPGPIVRMEYLIATSDLSYNETRVDTCPQITLLSGGITSNFVYNLEPQIPTTTGQVYYVTVRLYTADGGDTPVHTDTLLYFS